MAKPLQVGLLLLVPVRQVERRPTAFGRALQPSSPRSLFWTRNPARHLLVGDSVDVGWGMPFG